MAIVKLRNTKENRDNLRNVLGSPGLVDHIVVHFKDVIALPVGQPDDLDSKTMETGRIYHATDVFFGSDGQGYEGIRGIPDNHAKIYFLHSEFRGASFDDGVDTWTSRVVVPLNQVKEFVVCFTKVYDLTKRIEELEAKAVAEREGHLVLNSV